MNQNRFVFVVPMFNASKTLARMLHSICGQSYDNWRIILFDDVSDEEHKKESKMILDKFMNLHDHKKFEIIWNSTKKWETSNVIRGVSRCDNDEIICRLDADDFLTDLDALAIVNRCYVESGCDIAWTMHRWNDSSKNISGPLPAQADPYKYPWVTSHLKTFRTRLLCDVHFDNFKNQNGDWVKRAGDQAIYLPALYKTQKRLFIPQVMYHYTIDITPEVFSSEDTKFQFEEAQFIRKRGFIEH